MILEKTTDFANQVDSGQTVGISFYYYNKQNNRFVSSLVKKLLERQNKIFLNDTVLTVLKELIVNAVKANSKRYYFSLNNLDITDVQQYLTGMESFKDFIINQGEGIESDLRESKLRIELYFKKADDGLKIFVRNTVPLMPVELERIKSRIEKASKVNDFTEAYDELTDVSEGEGLGLLLTMLFLRNSGIGETSLQIASDGKITQSTLTIPSVLKPHVMTSEIQARILAEVDDLPTIPEHVKEIQELCFHHDIPMKVIADKIIVDPSLTVSVLKLSNSAGFITRNKVETVLDAIKIIGIKNLYAILSASSAKAAMDKKFSDYRQIWEHCNRVAFYAREIAEMTGFSDIADKVFLSAILHDLGKIILLATSSSLNEWISEITDKRFVRSSTIIEEISIGISHATIGELISRKWNMPDYVSETIKNHHSPCMASSDFFPIVAIVYLANELCNIENGRFGYHFLESDVLEILEIDSEKKFDELHGSIKMAYSADIAG